MKKFMMLIVFCLAICSFAFAQLPLAELDKVKKIKLLESTREDVTRIFADYPFSTFDFIPAERANISINYSKGTCSGEDEVWNVPEGKITAIFVNFRIPVNPQSLGVDLSKFMKERQYVNRAKAFAYHNKGEGIAYEVYEDNIKQIVFIPSKENYSLLCDKQSVRKYYSSKSWFPEKLKERRYLDRGHQRPFANVTDLTLSQSEITANCAADGLSRVKSCSDKIIIDVETNGSSYDSSDVLTYQYEVSGGRIVGQGKNVLWDLSGVKAGNYTIAAGVDNGCGICGRTMNKTVVVKECPDCSQKEKN